MFHVLITISKPANMYFLGNWNNFFSFFFFHGNATPYNFCLWHILLRVNWLLLCSHFIVTLLTIVICWVNFLHPLTVLVCVANSQVTMFQRCLLCAKQKSTEKERESGKLFHLKQVSMDFYYIKHETVLRIDTKHFAKIDSPIIEWWVIQLVLIFYW